MVKMVVF